MKKILSVMLALMLLVSCLCTVASAAEACAVSVSTVEAKAGSEVTVTVNVTGEFAGYGLQLSYDKDLTLTAIVGSGSGFLGNPATGVVGFFGAENVQGHSFTATFTVAADAKPGTKAVNVTVNEIFDEKANDLECAVVNGGVVISCEHQWGEWKVSKEATCQEAGEETRECVLCGTKETHEIAKLAHKWASKWEHDEDGHWHLCELCGEASEAGAHGWYWVIDKYATKEEAGEKHEECETCHRTRNEGTVIDKLPEDLDPVPGTYDIVPQLILSGSAVLSSLAAAAYVFKRRNNQ